MSLCQLLTSLPSIFGLNHSMIIPWNLVLIEKRPSRLVPFVLIKDSMEKERDLNDSIKKNHERDVNNWAFVFNLMTIETTSCFRFS